MSGACPPHCQRRNGTYHLRVRVPDGLKLRVGMLEVRRSLHVHTASKARPLALKYAARVMEVFGMAKAQELTREQVRDLIVACFHDLKSVTDYGFVPTSDFPDLEIDEQRTFGQERLADLKEQVVSGGFEPFIRQRARALVIAGGYNPTILPPATRHDLVSGVARALLEEQRLFLFRLEERLLPYEPTDPLFRPTPLSQTPSNSSPELPSQPAVGPTVQEIMEAYCAKKKTSWAAKTFVSRTRQLGYLSEHLGAGTRISALTPQHIAKFADAVARLRVNHHTGSAKSFTSRQTDYPAHRIAPKTAALIFEACKASFAWAKKRTLIGTNPACDVELEFDAPKQPKAKKSRRPFTAPELQQLFTAPLYTGRRSKDRLYEAGSLIVSDARYWVPLIGSYTGMRLGEIVQLHFVDLHIDDAIPHLQVTDEHGGAPGSGEEKHVKSHAGVRQVSLHPDLLSLGFGEFVTRRRKQRHGNGRVFFDVAYGADGMPSTVFSKWFGRFLGKAGLTDPALVFHSFRHGAEDAFRDALQPQYVIDRVIGHADEAVSSQYGLGVSLDVAYKVVKAMKLRVDLPKLLKNHRPPVLWL